MRRWRWLKITRGVSNNRQFRAMPYRRLCAQNWQTIKGATVKMRIKIELTGSEEMLRRKLANLSKKAEAGAWDEMSESCAGGGGGTEGFSSWVEVEGPAQPPLTNREIDLLRKLLLSR